MPQVGKKKYPYTEAGMKAAKMAAKKKPASAADFRKADQASIVKQGPLNAKDMKDYSAMHNAIAEKGMKIGGAAEGKYVRMYNKYNKPADKITGSTYIALKKDYQALVGLPAKKIVRKKK